jgi:hypothetical protein
VANPYPAQVIDDNAKVRVDGTVNFTDANNQPGGSVPGAAIVHGPFAFAYSDAGINNGKAFYTPKIGDVLLDLWIEIDTAFNGTTPLIDVGTFVGSTSGLLAAASGTFSGGTPDSDSAGTGYLCGVGSNATTGLVSASSPGNPRVAPGVFTAANPLKVVLSRNGLAGGPAPGGTQGAGKIYLVTATPTTP